jgi:Flp pilus assembly protein TadD
MVFGQTRHHEFINFDDDVYVFQNSPVTGGLTPHSVAWAFTHVDHANYHPLTTISHMADYQFFGANAGGHHVMNVLLHAATAICLFLVLFKMTGDLWCAAFVAFLFALHPFRVESVAWVAERKDVLSGFFFVLTLGAYAHYVRKPSATRYFLILIAYVLGLLAKPMLVTLPFVMLLLDYWPLRRVELTGAGFLKTAGRLVVEKIPFFVLSVAGCIVTIKAQSDVIHHAATYSLLHRVGNAMVGYAHYILAGISFCVWKWRSKYPWALMGWLWYVGMLVPVIGIIQVGEQARADRYTYLPQIGLGILVTWTIAAATRKWKEERVLLWGGALAVVVALSMATYKQVGYWHDSETLWLHTIASTSDNNALAESNLGNYYFQIGRIDDAMSHSKKALEVWPDDPGANNCVGYIQLQRGQMDDAVKHFQVALEAEPDYTPARNNLGLAMLQSGHVDDAVAQFQQALKINPNIPDAENSLGYALLRKGQADQAVAHYRRALELKPDYVGAANNLAWTLATNPNDAIRNGTEAVQFAERANRLTPNNLVILRTLAAAYAEARRFSDAETTGTQALQLAASQGNSAFMNVLQREVELYKATQPLRENPAAL